MIDHYCARCTKYFIGDVEAVCPNCWGDPMLAKPDMEATLDRVNHPPHYTKGGIECIDAIKAALTEDEWRGFCKGQVVKYVWREQWKGSNEDLEKAVWYLNRLLKGGNDGR